MAPAPRKKRRKKKPTRSNTLVLGLIIGGGALAVILATVGVLVWVLSSGKRDEGAVALLEKAIAANGADRAPQHGGWKVRGQGIIYDDGERIPATYEAVVAAGFRRARWTHHIQYPERAFSYTEVINGGKGWIVEDGDVSPMDRDDVADAQALLYLNSVESLAPLRDQRFSLLPLPEASIHGRPAVGIAVRSWWQAEVRLYFDKESLLLVKSARSRRSYGEWVTEEFYYSDHKFVQGVAMPMKEIMKNDGVTIQEFIHSDFQFLDSLDDRLFQKP